MHRELDYFEGEVMPAGVWRGKYALKEENDPADMHLRMAKEFGRKGADMFEFLIQEGIPAELSDIGKKFFTEILVNEDGNKIDTKAELRDNLVDKFMSCFDNFEYICPQGSVMSMLGNTHKVGSLSNCFVIGQPYDSYGGIFHKDQELAQLMKRRGGVGTDISTLRPMFTAVKNAANTSTGAVSFCHRYSNTTREVGQDGRRGALMLTIDIRHPDSLEFINMKKDRTKVTGANVSVMIRDDFMEAVKNDADYILRWPCDQEGDFDPIEFTSEPYNELIDEGDGTYIKRIKAKEYYDAIVHNAWDNAEPGQIFVDNHWDYSPDTVYPKYKGVTTNPCGEIFMGPYDACRLIALNLFGFVRGAYSKRAHIDFNDLEYYSYIQQILADILVELELEHIDRIIEKIKSDPEPMHVKSPELMLWKNIQSIAKGSRRTGSGFTALGDMLAGVNLKYDSEKALITTKNVMKHKMESELKATIDLSFLLGSFEGFDIEKEYDLEFTGSLVTSAVGKNRFFEMIRKEFPEQFKRMVAYGRRNVSWSTVAPTGSVSILCQTSSGMEPIYQPYYIRKKKINPGDKNVRVDKVDQNGDSWMEFPIIHKPFKDWIYNFTDIDPEKDIEMLTEAELITYYEKSPWFGSASSDIDWIKRVEMQACIQMYTTHSISSTINLPEDVTEQEVYDIYIASYDNRLKGVTIYRDNCRTGVLVKSSEENVTFAQNDAPKRPKVLPAEVHTTTSRGDKFNVFIGLLDGKPYECFLTKHFTNEDNLEIEKVKRGHYNLMKGEDLYKEEFLSEISDEQASVTRLVSSTLRHGMNIKHTVEQLNKATGDLTSFSKSLARVLKKYIKDGDTASGTTCDNCGSSKIIYQEGCEMCSDCGVSKC